MNKTVLKARHGTELRKNWIHHNNDVSLNDLVTKMQRYFDIKDASGIKLKYRDEEQDWITITNDDELSFALTSMEMLFIDVITEENIMTESNVDQNSKEANMVAKENDVAVADEKKGQAEKLYASPSPLQQMEQFTEIPLNGTAKPPGLPSGPMSGKPFTPPPTSVGQMPYNTQQQHQFDQMQQHQGPQQQPHQYAGMPPPPPVSLIIGAPITGKPYTTPPSSVGQMYYNPQQPQHQFDQMQQQQGPPQQPQQYAGMPPPPPPVSSIMGNAAMSGKPFTPTSVGQMYYNPAQQQHQYDQMQQQQGPPQQTQQYAGMPPPPPVSIVGASMSANPFSRQQQR